MTTETSPRKAAVALWIYSLTILTIGLAVNLWSLFFNKDLITVTRFLNFFMLLSVTVLSIVIYKINGSKPLIWFQRTISVGKETSPQKAAIAMWIYGATLATIVVAANLWGLFFDAALLKTMGSVNGFVLWSCVALFLVSYTINGDKLFFMI
jgi:hypothetical protein